MHISWFLTNNFNFVPIFSQVELLTNGECLDVVKVTRSAPKSARCRMCYLEFKKRSRPTDVDFLKPGSLCYVYHGKSKTPLRPGKVCGFLDPHIYLGRREKVAFVKIGRRLYEAPTFRVKPALAANTSICSPTHQLLSKTVSNCLLSLRHHAAFAIKSTKTTSFPTTPSSIRILN